MRRTGFSIGWSRCATPSGPVERRFWSGTTTMKCSDCGFGYDAAYLPDRRLHRKIHANVVDGPRHVALAKCRRVWRSGSRSVVVINSQSLRSERLIAQDVSLVAAGDGNDYTGLSYAADEEPDARRIHMFLGTESDRARAYLCLEWRSSVWRCTWDEYEVCKTHPQPGLSMWSVGYAWVARGHRRKGWIRTVLAAASSHLRFGSKFGWYTPFTPEGETLVRTLCPSGIYIAK